MAKVERDYVVSELSNLPLNHELIQELCSVSGRVARDDSGQMPAQDVNVKHAVLCMVEELSDDQFARFKHSASNFLPVTAASATAAAAEGLAEDRALDMNGPAALTAAGDVQQQQQPPSTSTDAKETPTAQCSHGDAEEEEARLEHGDVSSRSKFCVLMALACVRIMAASLALFMTSGLVFGFTQIKLIMISQGIYADLCHGDAGSAASTNGTVPIRGNGTGIAAAQCAQQDLQLDLIFQVMSAGINVAGVFMGVIVDLCNARFVAAASALGFAVSMACFGASDPRNGMDLYVPSYLFMGLFGSLMFFAMLKLTRYMPERWSVVANGVVSATWDLGSIVPYVCALLHFNAGLSLQQMFIAYAVVVGAAAVVVSFLVMPVTAGERRLAWHIAGAVSGRRANKTTVTGTTADAAAAAVAVATPPSPSVAGARAGDREEATGSTRAGRLWRAALGLVRYAGAFLRNAISPEMLLLYAHSAMWFLYVNFYMTTIDRQLADSVSTNPAYIGDATRLASQQDAVNVLTTYYAIMLPVLGAIASIAFGIFKDRIVRNNESVCFGLMAALNLLCLGCQLVPWWPLQFVTVAGFVAWRVMWFVNVSTHVFSKYGATGCATALYASLNSLGGIATFATPLLNRLVEQSFAGRFVQTNAIFGSLCAATSAAVLAIVVLRYRIMPGFKRRALRQDTRSRPAGAQSPDGSNGSDGRSSTNIVPIETDIELEPIKLEPAEAEAAAAAAH